MISLSPVLKDGLASGRHDAKIGLANDDRRQRAADLATPRKVWS
jgi:hypothetical protein